MWMGWTFWPFHGINIFHNIVVLVSTYCTRIWKPNGIFVLHSHIKKDCTLPVYFIKVYWSWVYNAILRMQKSRFCRIRFFFCHILDFKLSIHNLIISLYFLKILSTISQKLSKLQSYSIASFPTFLSGSQNPTNWIVGPLETSTRSKISEKFAYLVEV